MWYNIFIFVVEQNCGLAAVQLSLEKLEKQFQGWAYKYSVPYMMYFLKYI